MVYEFCRLLGIHYPKPPNSRVGYIDLIHEVKEVERMVIMALLLPNNLDCQMHIAELVAARVPSLVTPSKESLQFVEKFDEHIESRKRYEKQAKSQRVR